jgi:hypothetical protein
LAAYAFASETYIGSTDFFRRFTRHMANSPFP